MIQIHPQMLGMSSTRVPLPLDFSEDEPIYVNAKQYHAILRRREVRAKLEAQNKLVKARKVCAPANNTAIGKRMAICTPIGVSGAYSQDLHGSSTV